MNACVVMLYAYVHVHAYKYSMHTYMCTRTSIMYPLISDIAFFFLDLDSKKSSESKQTKT